jgi:hypothetical protein
LVIDERYFAVLIDEADAYGWISACKFEADGELKRFLKSRSHQLGPPNHSYSLKVPT